MKPLEGITVVELSTYIAAPSCGRILATQGAHVIKVEAPSGDVERKFGPTLFCPATEEENPIFDTINGGKDMVMLDLKQPSEMEKLHKLGLYRNLNADTIGYHGDRFEEADRRPNPLGCCNG